MPEREKYAHLFERNPFEAADPAKVFSLLHWGNKHKEVFEIDAPEPLVMLGIPKVLYGVTAQYRFTDGEAFLAVGRDSNELYIIPRKNDLPLRRIPPFSTRTAQYTDKVRQTDYLSTKGGNREDYYFHKHERPYPGLWLNHAAGVGYLRAAKHKGKPSYAVGKEGIVG
jgi:hypothetical protein